jgi:cytochrome b
MSSGGAPATVPVWDPLVRISHWLLVATVALAWLTRHGWGARHEWIGYGALAIIAIRFVWGFVGTTHARFGQFVRSPGATIRYAHEVVARREARHLGHNPLGACMIVALLVSVALAGTTGWLYTTDRFWGVEWVENLHAGSAEAVLWLAAVHVAGVLYASWRHRENLVAAMLHGKKRVPDSSSATPSRIASTS